MQTQRPAIGPAVPTIEPFLAPGVDDCRRLRVVARIDDPARWRAIADRLLAAGTRRWADRSDIADHPALRRWSRFEQGREIPERPCLRRIFAMMAAGEDPATGEPCRDFAAAVMLLSSCPAEAIAQDGPADAGTVRFSVYACREDDLPLAEALISTTVRACGVVVARHRTVVRRGPAPRPSIPVLDRPLPELLVLGGSAAR
ncbi:hypothetical protein [Nocardia neocaledoniensis]|uniref:hypothetical protein n=1 Tax=Nocardia neocaledoniensis TaxID=236511 RepID=UPI002456F858|nr:hypothetical protein [Nocardia neocaledoniensis]